MGVQTVSFQQRRRAGGSYSQGTSDSSATHWSALTVRANLYYFPGRQRVGKLAWFSGSSRTRPSGVSTKRGHPFVESLRGVRTPEVSQAYTTISAKRASHSRVSVRDVPTGRPPSEAGPVGVPRSVFFSHALAWRQRMSSLASPEVGSSGPAASPGAETALGGGSVSSLSQHSTRRSSPPPFPATATFASPSDVALPRRRSTPVLCTSTRCLQRASSVSSRRVFKLVLGGWTFRLDCMERPVFLINFHKT